MKQGVEIINEMLNDFEKESIRKVFYNNEKSLRAFVPVVKDNCVSLEMQVLGAVYFAYSSGSINYSEWVDFSSKIDLIRNCYRCY